MRFKGEVAPPMWWAESLLIIFMAGFLGAEVGALVWVFTR